MVIIIGLGNPGEQYKNTRHNVGFMAINLFAKENNFPEFKLQKKSSAEISEDSLNGEKIILAKPQTFMNESGKAVRSLTTHYPLQTTNLIVVHDDIDIPVGKIKIAKDRGSAGHKGVESIITAIGNENLIRIRIGIKSEHSHATTRSSVKAGDVVLENFSAEEQKIINETISKATEAIRAIISDSLEKAMSQFNQ